MRPHSRTLGVAFRVAVMLAGLLVVASALTGCVRNVANPAADWLAGRAGVASSEIVRSSTDTWSSSATVRGELDEGLDDAGIERLVDEILGYLASNQQVSFRLGNDRMDFSVADDAGTTRARTAVWRDVVGAPGLVNGLVTEDQYGVIVVDARALRESAADLYDALAPVEVATRLGLFRDEVALESDWRNAYYPGEDPAAATIAWGAECDPDPAIVGLAVDLAQRDDIVGGWLGLCDVFALGLAEPEDFTIRVPALRGELDAIPSVASSGLTVTLLTSSIDYSAHMVVVTPNDPAVFGILSVLEETGHPDGNELWTLEADGVLSWTDYGGSTSDLIARLAASPAAAALSDIEVTGNGSTVSGRIDELPGLLEQADALDAAAESIGSVHLSPTDASFYLAAEDFDNPDVEEAAGVLRESGLWQGRSIFVMHRNSVVEVRDGVVQPIPDYTDPEVIESFIEAWNASATSG
jgi:hypothetical protein